MKKKKTITRRYSISSGELVDKFKLKGEILAIEVLSAKNPHQDHLDFRKDEWEIVTVEK